MIRLWIPEFHDGLLENKKSQASVVDFHNQGMQF